MSDFDPKQEVPPIRSRSSFMRPRRPRKTRIVVPMALREEIDFEIVIRNDAYEAGEVYIEQGDNRLVTVRIDGTVERHS